MKNKTVKTVLGASILAATLSAQGQSTPKKLLPTMEPKSIQNFEIRIGGVKLNGDILTKRNPKDVKVKDSTEDLKTMLSSSKTEIAE